MAGDSLDGLTFDGLQGALRTAGVNAIHAKPLFNRLRTKETLGYSVDCSTRCTYGVMGFVIAVTSATHTPRHIEARVEAFLARRFLPFLSRMRKQTFLTNVEACAANKLREDHNLAEEMQRSARDVAAAQRVLSAVFLAQPPAA